MSDCIFCRIISGDIPAKITYQDDLIVAFEDLHPLAPVHYLLVPRKHITSLAEIDQTDRTWLAHVQEVAAELAKREGIAEKGFRLVANCGPEAGQEVMHLHYHLIGGRELGGIA